jgi:hypothetical protein
MKYNKLFFVISTTTFIIITFILLLSLFTNSSFAQSGEEEKEIMNQTMQDISKSTNQPIQNTTQTTSNDTGEVLPIQKNVTNFGVNITEGAKDTVGNIGEGIQNFSSGNLSLIL